MNELNTHYALLLGLSETWEVADVAVDPECQRVEIQLAHRGGQLVCPECQSAWQCQQTTPTRLRLHGGFRSIARPVVLYPDCHASETSGPHGHA